MPSERTSSVTRPARAKPARSLRFHLITWLVMFLVASVFLGLNVVPQGPYILHVIPKSKERIEAFEAGYCRGWPLHYGITSDPMPRDVDLYKDQIYLQKREDGSYEFPQDPYVQVNANGERYIPDPNKGEISKARMIPGKVGRLGAMFCNLLLGLSACGLIGLTVEWFARKRQG